MFRFIKVWKPIKVLWWWWWWWWWSVVILRYALRYAWWDIGVILRRWSEWKPPFRWWYRVPKGYQVSCQRPTRVVMVPHAAFHAAPKIPAHFFMVFQHLVGARVELQWIARKTGDIPLPFKVTIEDLLVVACFEGLAIIIEKVKFDRR